MRGAVSPLRWQGVAATERWVTLSRWIDAVESGRLLGIRVPAGLGRRGVAEHADGSYVESGEELVWEPQRRLTTTEVGEVLTRVVKRMTRWLARRAGGIGGDGDGDGDDDALTASAVSGHTPPAGPQWTRGLPPLANKPLAFDKPLCVSLDGFTLHAATRAGGADAEGREALLRYVLRPPLAQERVVLREDGLVRISLKRAYADGTVAVDLDPLSLLCRLAAAVPPPRHHLVKYAGVLTSASPWRSRIAPRPTDDEGAPVAVNDDDEKPRRGAYRGWAELLARTFGIDVLRCLACGGRLKLLAVITDGRSVRRYLARAGERTDVPDRAPARGPPYWKSTVLRRRAGDREVA